MPELPEVETIRRQMGKEIVGDTITHLDVLERSVFDGDEKSLVGEKVEHIGRVGKYLFVYFQSGRGLGIHLKMTGRLVISTSAHQQVGESADRIVSESEINNEIALYKRIVIYLVSGRQIYYWDTRKFGFIKVIEDIASAEEKTRHDLGPDPWLMDEMTLMRSLNKSKKAIKNALLDQRIISGVGNIYANDALWLAEILPDRVSGSLKLSEIRTLLRSLRTVMDRGMVTGGASDNTYRDFYGNRGSYQNEFLVYGKTHGECLRCGRGLTYVHIGGRGTWYCETCQK